ncbi:MAG: hypothetical protein ABSF26_00560 [Thermoguttaceae bacterium]|jgi:hypothetical protein
MKRTAILAAVSLGLAAQAWAQTKSSTPATGQAGAGNAFTSSAAGGNWSALATWQAQDGAAPKRIPGSGDTVTINGPVTVDTPVIVGTGSGDAIVLAGSERVGDKKLTVAAPLVVRGGVKSNGQSVIDVVAGAGIELDAAAGAAPAIHAAYGSSVHLYFRGAKDKRCYLRTRPGTSGKPGRVMGDGGSVPLNVGAAYTDFSHLGSEAAYGLMVAPSPRPQMSSIADCAFTRASLSYSDAYARKAEFTFSDCVFDQTIPVKVGDLTFGAAFSGNFQVSVLRCGFDKRVSLDQPKDVRCNVFFGNIWPHQYRQKAFQSWSDNLVVSNEPVCGYFIPRPGEYNRTYIIGIGGYHNEHIVGAHGPIVFDQCIWDVPLTKGYIDDALMVGGACTVRRSLALPRIGGENPNTGVSLGYVFGGPIRYDHNTVALGKEAMVHSDPSHGGKPGEIVEFKNNLLYVLNSAPKATGKVFVTFGGLKDPLRPEDCDYNGRWRSQYGEIVITAAGKLGEHDVEADPRFVDPTRNLTSFYRSRRGVQPDMVEKDVVNALNWIRRHPGKMPEMIDWVFAGYVPTNPTLRAASDKDGPTNGWIGAMEGKVSSQAAAAIKPTKAD